MRGLADIWGDAAANNQGHPVAWGEAVNTEVRDVWCNGWLEGAGDRVGG